MRYCEGLPSQGTRPLAPGERDRVTLGRRGAWVRFAVRLAATVAALAGAVPLGLAVAPLGDRASAVAVILCLFVAFPAALLWTRDAWREARAIGRDLSAGLVETFADGPRALVVLPRSGRILSGQGAPLARRTFVGEVAPPAPAAAAWAIPLSEIPERLHQLAWVRRPLAPAERDEIERRVAELRRPPIVLAALTALAAGGIVATLEQAGRSPAAAAFRLVAWAAVLGLAWHRVWRSRTLGARLEADAKDGWVAKATRGDAAGAEVLPLSGLPWSERGAPSRWRLAASAGRRWLAR